jgi:hypothetical protein
VFSDFEWESFFECTGKDSSLKQPISEGYENIILILQGKVTQKGISKKKNCYDRNLYSFKLLVS